MTDYKLCLCWIDTALDGTVIEKGDFLFNEPAEAIATISAIKDMFPAYHIWLEDRESNKVEVYG